MQYITSKALSAGGQDVARGLNPAKPIASHDMVALMRLLDDQAQASIRHRSINPLMDFVYSSLMAGAEHVAHVPVACRKGCSYCCNTWVDATPPEVLFTVKSMPADQRRVALEAVARVSTVTSGLSFAERCGKVVMACPLLDDAGACSVYQSRPVNCRTLVSTDAEQCRRTFIDGDEVGFPSLKVWLTLRDSYSTALEGALIHAGLAHQARELNASLQLALTMADAEQRWLAGADDFAGVPTSPAPAIFENPVWRGIYQQAFGQLP